MAIPDPYAPAHEFLTDEGQNPAFPGSELDIELAEIQSIFAQYRTNIALLQRADGALANGIVTTDSLDTVLAAVIGDVASLAEVQAMVDAVAADLVLTHADVVLTHADVVLTHADVVLTHADAIAAAASAAATGISGLANHGVPIANAATSLNASVALTDGQLLVGQTGANPQAKTVTGDVTITAAGATAIKASVSLTTPVLNVAVATSINKMAITAPATSSTLAVADGKTFTASSTLTLSGADGSTLAVGAGGTMTPSSSAAVYYDILPQNSKSAAYTTVLADANKHIYHPGADTTARIWTIDSNANVAYPIGTTLTFVNDTLGGVITIAITSDTLVLAGAGTTGSRTLAASGMATAIKMTATRWMISGLGLT